MANVLEIVQSVTPRMGIADPSLLFGSTNATNKELASVVNEVAERIALMHDWTDLLSEQTDTGDGTTTSYDYPADYSRMPKIARIWSTRWERPLQRITAEEALRLDVREYDTVIGTWHLLGGQVVYRPALASGENARWHYVSKNYAKASDGTRKASFTSDEDQYMLDDRMLGLAVVSRWREVKGFDYAEDLRDSEDAIAQQISRDKGARIITQASRGVIHGNLAYPWTITP